MSFKLVTTVLASFVVHIAASASSPNDVGFIYQGFRSSNLSLDGLAEVTKSGLLQVTNFTKSQMGHAFFPNPINFKNNSNSSAFSFSTHFVFAIVPEVSGRSGHGLAFVIAPTRGLPGGLATIFLGLLNISTNGNADNHVFAVELDTVQNEEFNDINDNHVGIDINSLNSTVSKPAGYHEHEKNSFDNLTLGSSQLMQLWVEYDGVDKRIDVTLAPSKAVKPNTPLLSLSYDLSSLVQQTMYVGFSASTGILAAGTAHFVLGWSFKMNGIAQALDLSRLPKLPRLHSKKVSKFFTLGLPQICIFLLLIVIFGVAYYLRRKRKFAEVLEDWELAYGPHRIKYKDLYIATKGFREKELLGEGGFGQVYKGVLPANNMEVAVKKVSHQTRQGMREFIAEIVSIGRLRHRNLVPLLGYCRRKGELLLVYEFMSSGSLDSYLYNQPKSTLNWSQRLRIIKGVASGLFYLHEEWEQMVIHRDVKASNVLLDSELNGRLGDFGLARLYDHGSLPRTTHVVGTIGYLAPEQSRTGKATTSTDVYAFGAFLLEVICGRRPIDPEAPAEKVVLVDWVDSCWRAGDIFQVVDQNLSTLYVEEEAELVLKLGLLCSHSEPRTRPSMRQVLLYLERSAALPEFSPLGISATGFGFDDITMSLSFSEEKGRSPSLTESVLSCGR
ncbi:L-type lectin-domain containing receptor kinase IV.1-like [Coffea eugenioides]|uniref:L-type lectin-domain containing receptor kinase IV.1-like n=1 Tax=Coffea eugenioides TaxID=49369 RepID=UPI000F60DF7F|nr:L-type lectin-domain containing receptor kinase IV.1-like [Coffea eugenioides]XP_027166696.1 L-type lectin-domain containing receptor kinase IV.1-like [Coffea eugenioides]